MGGCAGIQEGRMTRFEKVLLGLSLLACVLCTLAALSLMEGVR